MAVADEAAQGQVCQAANDNGGGQVVVSGDKAAVERAVEIAKTKGAKRAMLLPVSAPFHCRLMQPAADAMAKALAGVAIKRPVVAAGVERAGRADHRAGRDPPPPGRAGHRHRALARVGGLYGQPRRHAVFRNRRRQGAERAGQAHRRGRRRHFGRRARTILPRRKTRSLLRSRPERPRGDDDVRSDWQDGARHRRDRRHRRRDRAGAARARRDGGDFRHAARGAGHARRQAGRTGPCAALQSLRRGRGRGAGAVGRKGHGAARYSRRQCRHHARQSVRAVA